MSRSRVPRKPSAINLWQRAVCVVVVVVPPVVLLGRVGYGLLDYLDRILAQSAPLASAFASASLGRDVRIGSLTPFLSMRELWKYYRSLDTLGTLPIVASDITVANGESLQSSGELAYIKRLRAFVDVPALLAGRGNTAITRIEIESPRLFLVRRENGTFNVQELVKDTGKPPGAPFVTVLSVTDAAIRFTDRATKFPAPQTLALYPVNASATLGSRSLRFQIAATPKAGTVTARRLRGVITATGTVAQGKPGSRPDAALATDPAYTLRAAVPDADIAYFTRYLFGTIPGVQLSSGRVAAVQATFVAPTVAEELAAKNHVPKRDAPPPSVLFSAKLTGVNGRVAGVPTPLANIGGTVRYVSAGELVSFDLTGTAFASPVALAGSVWNSASPSPSLAVRFNAPRIPLSRVLTAFKTVLPVGVSVSGTAGASGFLTGTPSDLSGTASVVVPRVAVRGQGTVQNMVADLQYARGVLAASRVTAQTDFGGAVRGSGRVRFGEMVAGKNGAALRLLPQSQVAADFSLAAQRVSLPRIAALTRTKTPRISGTASVVVAGSTRGSRVSLTADVATRGLSVSGIPFSVAQARVVVRDNTVLLPQVQIDAPGIGSLQVAGNSVSLTASANTPLTLRFAATAVDAGRIAKAFGIANVGGIVNATGTVKGTLATPRLALTRFSVMNPRFGKYAAQSVTGANLLATKNAVVIPAATPLVIRRFPASVAVSGTVTDFVPKTTAKPRPVLALNVRVLNVDYSTVAPFLPPPDKKSALPAGTLTRADVRVTGFADAPRLAGTASFRRVLLADYPIESGEFAFSYGDGSVAIASATVTASVGIVTGKATVTRSGYVYGAFAAPALDLSRVSYLTEKVATLGGVLAVRGTFSGTRDRPVISASITPSNIVVAGTDINNLQATNIRYIANLEQNVQRIEVPRIALEQAGNTRLLLENGAYDFKRKYFAATVAVRSDSVDTLLATLRRSAFAQTSRGKQALSGLSRFPLPLDARFPGARAVGATGATVPTNRVTISGNAGETGIANYRVRGELFAETVRAGTYAADTIRVTLDKGNATAVAPGQPNIAADIEATNLRAGDFVAERVAVTGSLVGDTVSVTRGQLVSGTTTINASGTAGLNDTGRISASLDSNAVSFDLVRAFVPTLPLTGTFDITAFATGATRSPDLQASVGGQDVIVAPRAAADQTATLATGTPKRSDDAPKPNDLRLSFGAIARIRADASGKRFFELDNVQVSRRSGGQLLADARIPFSYASPYILPNAPIAASVTLLQLDLQTLNVVTATDTDPLKTGAKTDAPAGLRFFDGTVQGAVTLAGTLREPDLRGGITVTNGSFALPKVRGRETFNRIRDWDADIRLAGSRVRADSTVLLGGTSGKGDNGKLTVSADIILRELESALQSLAGNNTAATAAARPGTGTTINQITATFDNFKPVAENVLYLLPESEPTAEEIKARGGKPIEPRKPQNESFRGTINGVLTASGSVTAPLIKTLPGQPLRVTEVRVTPPGSNGRDAKPKPLADSGPRFAIEIDSPGKNTLSVGSVAAVDVSGSTTISGNAGRPFVRGRYLTGGGVLQYYIGRFTIDKGGQVTLTFAGDRGDVDFQNVVARTTAYLRPGATLSGESRTRGGLPIASSQPGADGVGTRYRITAQLQDKFFFGAGTEDRKNTFKPTFASDPQLTEGQIYALLVPQAQLAGVASGDFTRAGTQLLATALQQSVLPGLFAPIEDRLASALGLEQFSFDYSPSAPLTINLVKRFPDPLQRFVAQYTRTVQTSNNRAGGQIPYTLGLLYELYELRTKPGQPIPRLQFGVFTNEQRDVSGNLRATLLY